MNRMCRQCNWSVWLPREQMAAAPGLLGSKAQLGPALFQVYMFKCVWRCYQFIKCMNSANRSDSKVLPKVSLTGG